MLPSASKASQDVKDMALLASLEAAGFELADRAKLPERAKRMEAAPPGIAKTVLTSIEKAAPDGLFAHQARSLEMFLGGKDVCLATATASGKSLVFMAAAGQILATEPEACVLAIYPARALLEEQRHRWRSFLDGVALAPAVIDGGVWTERRAEILQSHRVVLMTPDVVHSWLLSRIGEPQNAAFVQKLRLLVLDEAHVYTGAFGTNTAYLLRRLTAMQPAVRLIASTATLGSPAEFLYDLSGRRIEVVGAEMDGSGTAPRTILEIGSPKDDFQAAVSLLQSLRDSSNSKFLLFADSRSMVEKLVANFRRSSQDETDDEDGARPVRARNPSQLGDDQKGVLPYRAGYEDEDRRDIQAALTNGTLKGVVATSALELGIDIKGIGVVGLLGRPSITNSFWQRCGRTGRGSPGLVIILQRRKGPRTESLEDYLGRPLEAQRLYLHNRYIQYAQALCAAFEYQAAKIGKERLVVYDTAPASFRRMLENELQPVEPIATDLYPLKQRAQGIPHYEFPLRSAGERSLKVQGPKESSLGQLSISQAIREAYPGGAYYYLGNSFRTMTWSYRSNIISARRHPYFVTQPIMQTRVFPRVASTPFVLHGSELGFIAELEVQVSERVTGFRERKGRDWVSFSYGPDSIYSQRDVNRFFETTGVIWFDGSGEAHSEEVARALMEAFTRTCGVQSRDLGFGTFLSKHVPWLGRQAQGYCIYDATNGSLRLTEDLVRLLPIVLADAIASAADAANPGLQSRLQALDRVWTSGASIAPSVMPSVRPEAQWSREDKRIVIATGQRALVQEAADVKDVTVIGYRYTPRGFFYEVATNDGAKVFYGETALIALEGETRKCLLDLMTLTEEPLA